MIKWLKPLCGRKAVVPAEEGEKLPPRIPQHVAIIMDGNGRWAKERGLPRSAGHTAGTEALRGIIRASDDWGIRALTLYAFSTENWSRPQDEVGVLMKLLLQYFSSEIDELNEKNVCIRILGDVEGLPSPQREAVKQAMSRTASNTGLKLNIALNYGGRDEITNAARILAQQAAEGLIAPEEISKETLADKLYTHDLPEVDLVIRTSGEIRLSNFLLWQSAYAELIFNKCYWPDYDRKTYFNDLWEYAARERRFGGVERK